MSDYTQTEGKDAFDILKVAGLDLLEWQGAILDDWLAKTPAGRWTHRTCGLSEPRQNGKTKVVVSRCAHGLIYLNEEIIYTSHLQKTSTETFEELAALFSDGPLSRYVKTIKEAIGREQIIMKDGGRIKFLARTRNGGRGQHGACLVFDEAQELDDNQQGSFLPAISASYNPQIIYTGTPPDENAAGTVFTRIRQQAHDGAEGLAWAEWSVPEIGDITDQSRWAETNPSFGILIQADTIESECQQMAPDRFARERLGWWQDFHAVHSVIDTEAWNACATDAPATDGVTVFAAKFEPGGNVGTICFCTKPEQGKPHIEFIESEPLADGLQWMEDFLVKVAPQAAQIVVDGTGYADTLLERLRKAGVKNKHLLIKPRAADMVTACAQLLTAVNEGTITHLDEENINAAATKTARRNIGKDGWGFASTDDGDASIIEACALAYWQAMATKRDPSRRGRIG